MTSTIIMTLLGFLTPLLPSLLALLAGHKKNPDELKMLLVALLTKNNRPVNKPDNKLADIPNPTLHHPESVATPSVFDMGDKLSRPVRPIITFGFFIFFIATKLLLIGGFLPLAVYHEVLDDNTMALLSGVIAFWFGDRTRGKIIAAK